jgi:hypothetical protein
MASFAPLAAAPPAAMVQRRSLPRLSAPSAACVPASPLCRRQAPLKATRRSGAALMVRAAAADEAPMQGTDPKTMTVSLPSVLDINEIMNRLPHRFPFLLVRGPWPCLQAPGTGEGGLGEADSAHSGRREGLTRAPPPCAPPPDASRWTGS